MQILSLEEHFKEICGKHPHLKLLESQWRFDEELIAKALQNVSTIFPHYSRHDASHSRQIIVNIERMLGEKIKYLTASDTWLIFEAAYNHDIGMVITQKQLKDIDSEEFRLYINEVASQPSNPLHQFATNWKDEKAQLPKGSDSHIFLNKYIQLLAEWYRKKHPENSAKIVDNPADEIGLNSPRNELLPKRLFGVLSKVCRAHGQSFSEVMKLPFSEAGMATEDCHPRYVACLLRMADLLDLDDNRFCPVMLHMCGEHLPKISKSHLDKHHSIKHFRLDSERIEVDSECPSPESYEVAFEWFKWLEAEYHQQTQHWDKIVPSRSLGSLPTLTTPSVTIKEPYLILEQGRKPNFRVDQTAILELVRSTGLYTSKFDSIREVLQNAVDATLIAIWHEHKSEIENSNPLDAKLNSIFNKYPITVDTIEDGNNGKFITLKITDQGTGINFETLKFMLEVGSSHKNKSKKITIDEMPPWYRPSGNFGLGLQSIYLISDRFTIYSKSRETHEAIKVSFSEKSEKSVVINKISTSSIAYGTSIEIKIKIKKFPDRMEIISRDGKSILSKELNAYDFTKSGANLRCYEKIKIYESLDNFNTASPIKINYIDAKYLTPENNFFCNQTNVILRNVNFSSVDNGRLSTFFRGQRFSGFNYILPILNASIDFYGHSAKDFLTYNRERILTTAQKKARTEIIKATLNYINDRFTEIPEDQKPYAAAFCLLNNNNSNPELEKYLLEYNINFADDSKKLLENIISDIKLKNIKEIVTQGYREKPKHPSITLHKNNSSTALDLIVLHTEKNGLYHQIVENNMECDSLTYQWGTDDIEPISEDLFKKFMRQEFGGSFGVGNRILFPCWGKYRKLAISTKINWARIFQFNSGRGDLMVLPCNFIDKNKAPDFHENIELASWVHSNAKDPKVSEKEIFDLYNDLSLYLKKLIEE